MYTKGIPSEKTSNPLWYLFQKTWSYSTGNRNKIVLYWVMFIMAQGIFLVCSPLIMSKIMNVVQKQGVTRGNIVVLFEWLLVTLVIDLIFWALHGPARVIEILNSFKARMNYRKHLLKGVMTLPMEWHVEHHSGDTIDKIEKGTTALFQFSEYGSQFIYAGVQFVISYGMLVYFSQSSAYIVLLMMALTLGIIMLFDKILIGQYKILNHAENAIVESVFDAISNISTVIILRVERLVFEAIGRKIEKPYDLFQRNNRLNEIKWFLTNICCRLMIILVLGAYFYAHMKTSKIILIGDIYLLVRYLEEIKSLFQQFAAQYSDVLKYKSRILNSEELSKDFRPENFTNHVLPKNWQKLSVENLTFSYHTDEGNDLHLRDISLSIAKGERIAFVGKSGSGKTTLLKVIRDLYHPLSMKLLVDGSLISQGFEGISRAIALVPQNPEIFSTTILENVTLGAEYDPTFVERFIAMACFTEVLKDLPHGLDSSIKEKGVNLSGGQQQRLALARGLLACHDKDIVLLDEPTSSLDTANEMRIYQNIFREFNDKTVISSIHRLHLLPLFHRICFMSDGEIVASGNLNELLTNCSEFQGLWQQYHEAK
jgi:ATP-binding cassette subfamily B protein